MRFESLNPRHRAIAINSATQTVLEMLTKNAFHINYDKYSKQLKGLTSLLDMSDRFLQSLNGEQLVYFLPERNPKFQKLLADLVMEIALDSVYVHRDSYTTVVELPGEGDDNDECYLLG